MSVKRLEDGQKALRVTGRFEALQRPFSSSGPLMRGTFDREWLAEKARMTDTTATELADELVRSSGLDFQDAHHLSAELAARLHASGRPWQSLTPADLSALGGPALPAATLAGALDPAAFVMRREGLGGPAPSSLEVQLDRARDALVTYKSWGAESREHLGGYILDVRTITD